MRQRRRSRRICAPSHSSIRDRVSPTFFFSALGIISLLAFLRGGAPERWVALILLLTALADLAFVLTAGQLVSRDIRILVLDCALAIAITIIALHAERYWPMLIAAFLIVGAELQIGVWLAPVHEQQVFKVAHAASAYPVLFTLLVGTLRHWWRTRKRPERDWTVFR